jgi:uncharacterized tellurite resistance protein B-like protein
MANAQGNQLLNSLDKIFANTQQPDQRKQLGGRKNQKINTRELELALTVLLVDLAACDENFQPEEYQVIANGLRRLFGTTKEQVQALVNQATQVLRNLRGTSHFGTLLKDNLSEEQRYAIMETVEDIINADGVVEGFEIYLKHKITDLLGLPKQPLVPIEDN